MTTAPQPCQLTGSPSRALGSVRRGAKHEDLAGSVLEHPGEILGREAGPYPGAGAGTTTRSNDSTCHSRPERVDRRSTPLDPRVDGHPGSPRGELDGLEDRHRPAELAVLDRCLEAELERDDEQVRGDEHGTPRLARCAAQRRGRWGRAGDRRTGRAAAADRAGVSGSRFPKSFIAAARPGARGGRRRGCRSPAARGSCARRAIRG